ncbi:MAG: hypothetical protein NZ993_04245 [Bacteroidetes bacterium]|nr:hypothetical protein [Bacteroidota bacterium]
MDRLSVGIAFEGSVLYYAEIEHQPLARRLVRLGSCEFSFPLEPVLLGPSPPPGQLDTVRQALESVLGRSLSRRLTVSAPLSALPHAFIPLPPDASPQEQARSAWWELERLYPVLEPSKHRLRCYTHHRPDEAGAVLAVAVSEALYERWRELVRPLAVKSIHIAPTLVAAERAFEVSFGERQEQAILLVGAYHEYTEVALRWQSAWAAAASYPVGDALNALYFGLRLLEAHRIGLSHLGRVYYYTNAEESAFGQTREVLRCPIEPLDPFAGLVLQRHRLPPDLPLSTYALPIGAALGL